MGFKRIFLGTKIYGEVISNIILLIILAWKKYKGERENKERNPKLKENFLFLPKKNYFIKYSFNKM